jgi:hypothetical protein
VNRPIKMLSATLVLGAGLGASGAVSAADDATLNHCWGQVTKQFAALGGPTHPGLGEHASDPPGFNPGDGGRLGVGNVSKTDPDFDGVKLSEGAQGVHAIEVAPTSIQKSLPEECQGTEMP